jgi:hypothetical protein
MKYAMFFGSCLVASLLSLAPQAGLAKAKFDAILVTSEQTMVKTNHQPEKLMSKILTDDFNKGKIVHIVERPSPAVGGKNPATGSAASPAGEKLKVAKYAVDAKLNALVLMPGAPADLGLHLNLTNIASTEILTLSQTTRRIDSKMLEEGSNLSTAELEKSEFGKLLTDMTHEAVKTFETKLEKIKTD